MRIVIFGAACLLTLGGAFVALELFLFAGLSAASAVALLAAARLRRVVALPAHGASRTSSVPSLQEAVRKFNQGRNVVPNRR